MKDNIMNIFAIFGHHMMTQAGENCISEIKVNHVLFHILESELRASKSFAKSDIGDFSIYLAFGKVIITYEKKETYENQTINRA